MIANKIKDNKELLNYYETHWNIESGNYKRFHFQHINHENMTLFNNIKEVMDNIVQKNTMD